MLDEFVDLTALVQIVPEYRAADAISIAREAMQMHLASSMDAVTTWSAALDAFEGTDCVPW